MDPGGFGYRSRLCASYNDVMATLTLDVDDQLLARAQELARARNTTVSQMVERLLEMMAQPLRPEELPPLTRELSGMLPPMTDEEVDAAIDEYRMKKYGQQ